MKSAFYVSFLFTFLFLLFSCGDSETQKENKKTELRQDTLANKTEVYIHSIEYRKVLDCPVPNIIDVYIVGLQENDVNELVSAYDRCKLATPDDSIYVDMFLSQNDLFSRIRFHNCCFLMDHTKNEIHATLKKARITFYNDSTKCEIHNSEELIETAYTEVRMGLIQEDELR